MIEFLSPAKINLDLKIGKYNEDIKLHHISSHIVKTNFGDIISLQLIPERQIRISFEGKYAKGIPNNDRCSIYKVLDFLRTTISLPVGFKVQVIKNIPLKSGLGGASSNAGMVLYHALGLLLQENIITFEKKEKVVSEFFARSDLGMDSFFFFSFFDSAHVSGFGEKITPWDLPANFPRYGVFVFPEKIHISTPWAYEIWKQKKDQFLSKESNHSFESIVFEYFPDLKDLKNLLLKEGATQANMSGSGSTLFGLFIHENKRDEVSLSLLSQGYSIQNFSI